jgi:hypothetical protein
MDKILMNRDTARRSEICEGNGGWIDRAVDDSEKNGKSRILMMMPALRGMDVRLWRRRRELTGQHDPSSVRLLGQMLGHVRVKCSDVSDQALQESPRLKFASGKFRYDRQQPIEDIRGGPVIYDLLRLLFDKCVIFPLQPFGEDRHGSRRNMERTECPSEGLNSCDYLCVLAVPAIVKMCEGDNLDQIAKGCGFLASQFTQLAVQIAADRSELFAEPPLLVFAAGVEVGAVGGAEDSAEPVFPATLTTDQSRQRRAGTASLPLVAIDALAHFGAVPPASVFGGATNP